MPDYSNETELKNEDQFEELEIEKVKSEIEGDSTANLTIREADGENDFVTIQIDESKAKTRLDKLICQELDLSRARVEALIDDGMVCLNGQVAVKASKKVQVGDVLEIELPEPESTDVLPEKMDLDIVYEDSDIIVINKQRGLVVHPAPGHYKGTLVNGLLYHCQDLSGINGVARPGIVHRIDKDTTGLLVVAKNDLAHESLAKQIMDKTCKREYLAIVHEPFSHRTGTIHAPIGRDEKDRQKMAVTSKNSRDAVTRFEVLENFDKFALVRCALDTGRTHQIRVHMAYIHHPVAADPKYGRRNTLPASGQLLHACHLELIHPRTGEKMAFDAEPDDEFNQYLNELRALKENQ
ncbi:RluA family pseudouridine synthase [Ileibacterium valens]|uniref:RluA family pseudouridine synthase n=1 Tax=Ileibacterium valens TaxID=1862668 RepID=UPI00272D5E63|nr:RluA family pseudouridine synthase [Ileibacterium valens]